MMLRTLRPARTDRKSDRECYVAGMVESLTMTGSRTHPPDPANLRALAERSWERGVHPAGIARQVGAIFAAWNRTRELRRLRLPATVIHGWEDRVIMPSGGLATARAIPDSRLVMFAGMGHDLPRPLWPKIIDAILTTA
jgi:pimeloyl-ACP methyl ester carboxylesterase